MITGPPSQPALVILPRGVPLDAAIAGVGIKCLTRVLLGDALEGVDGDGADHGPAADAALDDLDEGLQGLHVAELAEGGDGDEAEVIVLRSKSKI